MKKILIGCLALSMLAITSCKKPAKVDGGTFTFKGNSYSVNSAIGNTTGDNAVVAISQPSNQYNQLQFTFFSDIEAGAQVFHYPIAGSYTVVRSAPADSTQVQVSLQLTNGATYNNTSYWPDTITGIQAAVTVSNGKLNITLPSITMFNKADTTRVDQGVLNATIKQTGDTQ